MERTDVQQQVLDYLAAQADADPPQSYQDGAPLVAALPFTVNDVLGAIQALREEGLVETGATLLEVRLTEEVRAPER